MVCVQREDPLQQVQVAPDRVCHVGCLRGVSKSVQVLCNGIGAVLELSLIVLK